MKKEHKPSVTVDFELGRVRASLTQLQGLTAGTRLPVLDGTPASVAIVCAGRTMGRGEIVDVHGQLGIRIIEWGVPS
jgi:type III secretion protein Q